MYDVTTFDAESAVRLRRAIGQLARLLNPSAANEDLTPTQASVLAIAGQRGPLALAELAQIERINPTMLSRIISKLDNLELIRRTPNPADQRAMLIEATEAGLQTSERIRQERSATLKAVTDSLPEDITATLLAALPALEALADGLQTE